MILEFKSKGAFVGGVDDRNVDVQNNSRLPAHPKKTLQNLSTHRYTDFWTSADAVCVHNFDRMMTLTTPMMMTMLMTKMTMTF